jgi:ArsR family transcriptional regulator
MAISSDRALAVLRAVGEDTRLRIVALLHDGELTVSDLVDVLGQSQPRISRHLKLLTDAGVVDKHREGTWAFFDLSPSPTVRAVVDTVLTGIAHDDPTLAGDRDRRAVVQQRRTAAAQEYFARIADRWDQERSLHAPDDIVEAAIVEIATDRPYRRVLDLGTGTGRMLQLLAANADAIDRAVGLDSSHAMLGVARANLQPLRHVDLRQGDVYRPPFDRDEFDLVVIHQVLHFLDDPARAIREAARLLTPAGRLVIVDFAPHSLEFLRTDHAHRRLGFRAETIAAWLAASGLEAGDVRVVGSDHAHRTDGPDRLTVSLWVGTDPRPADRPLVNAGPTQEARS